MSGVNVGQEAPSFRLPTAEGNEIALEEFRGRKNVIVWFTKGMGCPFCRAQMSQLARAYPDVQQRDAEVLLVSLSTPSRAKSYAKNFNLPFPYLCDPDYRTRAEWNLGYRSHGVGYYVRGMISGMTSPKPPNDYGDYAPPLDEMPKMLADDDMGFFIIDKQGIVRYALAGSYLEGPKDRKLPSNEEILRELGKCQTAAA